MAHEKDGSGGLPIAGIAAVLLLALGIGLPTMFLESTRPTPSHVSRDYAPPLQQIPARLWEDPFEAVSGGSGTGAKQSSADTSDRAVASGTNNKARSGTDLSDIHNKLRKAGGNPEACVSIMPVMVFGGPYAEYSEVRRRTRYAVVSGLLRSNFSAHDEDHIGYVRLNKAPQPAAAAESPKTEPAEGATSNQPATRSGLPAALAFEWFDRPPNAMPHETGPNSRRHTCRAGESVLVLWLDQDMFDTNPIWKLGQLVSVFAPEDISLDRVRLIGPASSTILQRMREEAQKVRVPPHLYLWPLAAPLEIYVWGATAPTSETCAPTPRRRPDKIVQDFAKHGISLLRTVVEDHCVVQRLVQELKHRAVSLDERHIALLAESETVYGKYLLKTLKSRARMGRPVNDFEEELELDESDGNGGEDPNGNVAVFKYLRGLDGETARAAAREAQRTERSKDEKKKPEDNVMSSGVAQFDYIRRAAAQIHDRHDALRTADKPNAVVGVLGTDFYDKSLLLQALRREMPQALFFTTDIDARMTDANQRLWSRNLLVASGLGLRLRDELQKGVAPFRDSYQTSVFLSVLIALNSRLAAVNAAAERPRDDRGIRPETAARALKAKLLPRAYEVGRREIFDFGPSLERAPGTSGVWQTAQAADQRPCSLETLFACDTFGPEPSSYVQLTGTRVLWALAVAAAALILVLRTSWFARGMAKRGVVALRTTPVPAWTAFILLVAVAAWMLYLIWFEPIAEPFRWDEGFSAWPSMLLRFAATLLACAFCCVLVGDHRHMRMVLTNMGLPNTSETEPAAGMPRWARFLRAHFARLRGRHIPRTDADLPEAHLSSSIFGWAARRPERYDGIDAQHVVNEYLVLASFLRRFERVAPLVLVYIILGLSLTNLWDPPNAPIRGAATLLFHKTLLFTYIALYSLLLFAVVDAVRLIDTLAAKLVYGKAQYAVGVVDSWQRQLGLPSDPTTRSYVAEWLNVRLIADQTESTVRLVYFPFVILAIALVARSQIFDNWHTPWSLTIIFAIGAGYTAFAIVHLRRTAERVRSIASEWMAGQLLALRGNTAITQNVQKQLEALLDDVKNIRKGAFLPLPQQPLWKAVLLPLSGFGGVEALQYLWLMNN
jgi:hypothetical protein